MEENKQDKLKEVIQKLKKVKKMTLPPPQQVIPQRSELNVQKKQIKVEKKVQTQQDFRKMPYEGKVRYDYELKNLTENKKEIPESGKKKKNFWDHYDKQSIYEPAFIKQTNHQNPSGRPPNIPDEMYIGVVVKPVRPWIYFPEDALPQVQCDQNNDQAFKNVMKKTKENNKEQNQQKRTNEPKVKKRNKIESDYDEQDHSSNFEFSDSLGVSGMDSALESEIRSRQSFNREKNKRDMFDESEEEQFHLNTHKKKAVYQDSQNDNDEMMAFNSDEDDLKMMSQDEKMMDDEESDLKPKKKEKKKRKKRGKHQQSD